MNKCNAINETTHKKMRKKTLKTRPNLQLTMDMNCNWYELWTILWKTSFWTGGFIRQAFQWLSNEYVIY